MTFDQYMKEVEACLRELHKSDFWLSQSYESKLVLVTGFINTKQTVMESQQTVQPVVVIPDNPKFVETDVLGNPKKKPGRPKGSNYMRKE